MIKNAGLKCDHCGNLGANAEQEGHHNTGECNCKIAKSLCWREWWGICCQYPFEIMDMEAALKGDE